MNKEQQSVPDTSIADSIAKQLADILGLAAPSPERYEEKVEEVYHFPMGKALEKLSDLNVAIDKINLDSSCATQTLQLRQIMHSVLHENDELSDDARNKLAEWIIRDWGGIQGGNKTDSSLSEINPLLKLVNAAKEKFKDEDKFDFNRIASWSKYYAFKEPDKYAIYDARVIYSLNWLLFLGHKKKYFPMPQGQNSVMNLLNYQIFLYVSPDENIERDKIDLLMEDIRCRRNPKATNIKSIFVRNLLKKHSPFYKENEAFGKYCNLLRQLSNIVFGEHYPGQLALTKTEMLLFSIANAEIAASVLAYIEAQARNAALSSS